MSQETAYSGDKPSLDVFGPTERIPELGLIYQKFRGKRYPPFISIDATKRLMNEWHTDEHDIIICTHQKVGTHLTKKFVVELLRATHEFPEGSGLANGDIGHGTVRWPEVTASQHGVESIFDWIEETKGHPRVWYTHCCREDLPVHRIHPKTRFIIVVRDPRAAIVSQFHFYKKHPLLGANQDMTIEALAEYFVQGKLYFGGYHEHALSWMNKARAEINIEQAVRQVQQIMVDVCIVGELSILNGLLVFLEISGIEGVHRLLANVCMHESIRMQLLNRRPPIPVV